MRSELTRRQITATLLSLIAPRIRAESHSAFPVDITGGLFPRPVAVNGHTHLVYELHLTNFSASPIEFLALDIFATTGSSPLASYRGEALEKLLLTIGPAAAEGHARTIGGGRAIIIFLDLALSNATRTPAELRLQFTLSIKSKNGATSENTVNAPHVAVASSGSASICF